MGADEGSRAWLPEIATFSIVSFLAVGHFESSEAGRKTRLFLFQGQDAPIISALHFRESRAAESENFRKQSK
jgi:hypothetical protein